MANQTTCCPPGGLADSTSPESYVTDPERRVNVARALMYQLYRQNNENAQDVSLTPMDIARLEDYTFCIRDILAAVTWLENLGLLGVSDNPSAGCTCPTCEGLYRLMEIM